MSQLGINSLVCTKMYGWIKMHFPSGEIFSRMQRLLHNKEQRKVQNALSFDVIKHTDRIFRRKNLSFAVFLSTAAVDYLPITIALHFLKRKIRVKKSSCMKYRPTCRLWNLVARSLAHRCIGTKPTDLWISDAIEERSRKPAELTLGACHHCNPC